MAINATNYPYNIQNITGGGNVLEFVQGVNHITGGSFMLGMLFVGWVVLFVSMRGYGNRDSLLASTFIIAVMAIFFKTLEFISTSYMVIVIIIFAIIFVATLLKSE